MVSDFGVAMFVHAAAAGRLTATGLSPGTPGYMSPEQAAGDRQIDGRSDIYSLGCVLYEMLTGDPPFTGTSMQAVLAKKLLQPVPSTRIVRDTIPELLDDVTLKALARTPADRFRTAGEFERALEEAGTAARAALTVRPHSSARGERGVADAPAVRTTADPGPRTDPGPAFSASQFLAVGAAILLLLTAIGFLTTTVYDVKMQVPSEFTPSRWDFPIVGCAR